MYGPLPAVWSSSQAEAWSPPVSWVLASFESTTLAMVLVSTDRNPPGLAVLGILKTTVSGSIALTLSVIRPPTPVIRKAGELLIAITRLIDHTTSSAVMGLPLANLLPGCSL